jgi:hypothetical protein
MQKTRSAAPSGCTIIVRLRRGFLKTSNLAKAKHALVHQRALGCAQRSNINGPKLAGFMPHSTDNLNLGLRIEKAAA